MSRRLAALKPQLNRIRAWAYEGSTDAWIAHQLETTAEAVRAFRLEHGIERGGPAPLAPITPDSVVEAMLAEEEAAAAEAATRPADPEPDAAPAPEVEPEQEPESAPAPRPRKRTRRRAAESTDDAGEQEPAEDAPAEQAEEAPARSSSNRRRGARGGSGRSATAAAPVEPQGDEPAESAEATEPSGDEEPSRGPRKRGRRRGRGRGGARGLEARLLPGSVLLLDPAVTADALFQEHWQDAGALRVEVSADAIVLRRVAEPEGPSQ